ncbi:MAG: metallophosphoesterase [Deltaproteobacteria bacterium]|nr:metallophosphoesterase [Deltaproteobacteria bacterium]
MNRRDFLRDVCLALTSAWGITRLPCPRPTEAGSPPLRLALLADAHLKNGDPARAEALALARAVAEIKVLKAAPDLVLFAGDLAHNGNPQALALGREILSELPFPLLPVRGEGDGPAESTAWKLLFGEDRFARNSQGVHIIGLNTALGRPPDGRAFTLGEGQLRWLAQELRRLDPAAPLIILSHAPLNPIFQPWRQWTADAHRLAPHLARFRRVIFLHGHVHHAGVRCQVPGARSEWPVDSGQWPGIEKWSVISGQWSEGDLFSKLLFTTTFTTKNQKPKTKNLPIPATAWPLPSPLEGTPRRLQPGLAPQGCGWGLLSVHRSSWTYGPCLWDAA